MAGAMEQYQGFTRTRSTQNQTMFAGVELNGSLLIWGKAGTRDKPCAHDSPRSGKNPSNASTALTVRRFFCSSWAA